MARRDFQLAAGRNQRSEDRRQQADCSGQKTEDRRQRTDDRDSPVGAAFSRDSNNFYDFYDLNDLTI